jgi:methyl-accepting chemotaxis protein
MGILKKMILGLLFFQVIAFTLLAAGVNLNLRESNKTLTDSLLAALEDHQGQTLKALTTGFEQNAKEVAALNQATNKILNDLFTASCETLTEAVAHQVYPMVESFDFEAVGKALTQLIETGRDVKWARITTSESPQPADIREFGSQSTESALSFSHQLKGKFAFLQLEIQFSLGRLQESSRSMEALFKTVQDGNRRLIGEIQSGGDRAAGEAKSAAILTARQSLDQATRRTIFLALAVLVAICASFAYFIRRWIGRPVTAIVDRLSVSADQAASNSSQVSSSSHTLAEGASKQAAAIEETSSSLEEMSAMISKNADYSRQADALMQQTQQIVAEANGSMTNLMGSMTEITRASEETFKIVKTIDEIAFQTNLLALNAAVEAARAGQSGAGFAVVADEVRNLARRAADAAHNTAQLIDATIQKVQTGSKMVGGANDTFAKVAESAGQVADLVSGIAAASREQAQGISQVNAAITEIDRITQRVAAVSEESSTAAQELNARSEETRSAVEELSRIVNGAGRIEPALPDDPPARGAGLMSRIGAALTPAKRPASALPAANAGGDSVPPEGPASEAF